MLSMYHTKRNTFHSISRLLLAKCNDNAEHFFSIAKMCMYMYMRVVLELMMYSILR